MRLMLAQAVWSRLSAEQRQHLSAIDVYDHLPSTQLALMQRSAPVGNDWLLVLAKAQTSGIGRQGREWVSPLGQVAFSWRGMVTIHPEQVGLLSLAVALAVQNALNALGVSGVQLKWPNDIYVANQKLAGILISVCGQKKNRFDIVVGVGLNRLSLDLPPGAVALSELMSLPPSMDKLIATIVMEWLDKRQFLGQLTDVDRLLQEWKRHALWLGLPIRVLQSHQTIDGVFRDITSTGALVVMTATGEQIFMAGDVQLRPLR